MRWLLLLTLAACGPLQAPEDDETKPASPSDPMTLKLEFEAVVAKAKAGDEAGVAKALEGYLADEATIKALFGPRGEAVWGGYSTKITSKLKAEAAKTFIAQVKAGRTEVDWFRLGPASPANTTAGDRRMLEAMVERPTLYNVRLFKAGEALGLRMDGFFYREGRWQALFKAYEHLPDGA